MCDDGDMCPWWIPLFTEGSSLLRKSVQPWWVGFVCSVCKGISPLWYLIISLRFRCILKDTRTVQSPFSQHFRTFLRTSELVALSHFHPPAASDGAKMRTVGQVSERLAWFSMDQATVGFAMRGLGLLLFHNRYLSLQTIFHPTADFSIGNSRFSELVRTFFLSQNLCLHSGTCVFCHPQLFLRAAEWQCQLSAITGASMKFLRGLISISRSATVKMFTPVKCCDLVSWDHGLPCQHQLSFPMWNSALLVITNVKIIYMCIYCTFCLWNVSIIFFLYLNIFWVKTCGECLNVSCNQSRLCCR